MGVDPQKLFIGLMELFTILLPGALLTMLLMDEVGPTVLGDRYGTLTGPAGGAAFLLAAYLVGHLVFLLSAWLDELWDWARRHTLDAQVVELARRSRLLPWPARALVWLAFKREDGAALAQTIRLMEHALDPLQARGAVNAFQWSKALLRLESPSSLAVVERFEADSKFFRSLTVVLLVLVVTWSLHDLWPPVGVPVALALVVLALWRYGEQRLKSINQAYWSVITLAGKSGQRLEPPPAARHGLTHAGGVVFREHRGIDEYLLVEATDDPSERVLPKGKIEGAELPLEAAVREVHEETGVWAKRRSDLGDVSYEVRDDTVVVRFYRMEAVAQGRAAERNRRHVWLASDAVVNEATHELAKDLLRRAIEDRAADPT